MTINRKKRDKNVKHRNQNISKQLKQEPTSTLFDVKNRTKIRILTLALFIKL